MAELQSKPILLSDVVIQELADGEVLTYDETTSKWINQAPTSGNLSTLSDIAITEQISDSSSLIYNSYLQKWINVPYDVLSMDFTSLYVCQIDYTGGGTSASPSYYNYNSTYRSLVVDASFVSQTSSYFIKLPTDLSNGSIVYIQVATVGSADIGIMGGATIQDNIYYGPNQWSGYQYSNAPTIYKFRKLRPSDTSHYLHL